MKARTSMAVPAFALFSLLAFVTLILLSSAVFGTGDDEESPASPTPPSFSQNLTRTAQATQTRTTGTPGRGTPTPLPTSVALNRTPSPFPTSQLPPTSIFPPVITQPPNVQTVINITSPVNGNTLTGNIAITGNASHPQFVQYALEYGPNPNPSNLWYPITSVPITRTVLNGILGAWNTLTVADGSYQIRLHVWLSNGPEQFSVVNNLQVRNSAPTPTTNRNPVISPIAALNLTQAQAVTLALGISDPDNDPVTYLAQSSKPSVATVAPSGSAAITVNALAAGTATITVSINDNRGGTASTSFSVTVAPPVAQNNPPAISQVPAQQVTTGQTLNIAIAVSDPNNDTFTVGASSSAPNIASVVLNNQTLTIKGENQGSAVINVSAVDSKGLGATMLFTVTVTNPVVNNQPPVLSTIGAQTVQVASTKDINFTASDPNNDPLALTASSSNNGVVTASIVGNNIVRIAGVAAGTATITLRADDNKGGITTTTFNVTAEAPPQNQPPVITAIGNQTLDVGQTINVNVTASDPDAGDTVSLSAVADPANLATVGLSGNTLNITGVAGGTATVTVTASDGKTTTNTTFQVTVNAPVVNTPPIIDPISDQVLTLGNPETIIIIAGDPDVGDTLSYGASSGDVGIVTISVNSNMVTLNPVALGSTSVTVSATDSEQTTERTFNVTVEAPPNTPPQISALNDQTCTAGDSLTIPLGYSDLESTVTIDAPTSSDNAIAQAYVVDNFNLGLDCLAEGSANITVTIRDTADATASDDFNVSVAAPPVNNPPTISQIFDQTCNVGDVLNLALSYNDPEGDSVTVDEPTFMSDGFILSVYLNDPFNLGIDCLEAGFATITVIARDANNAESQMTFGVTVQDVAPPPFDVTVYPEIPDLGPIVGNLQSIISTGQANGRFSSVFTVLGDESVASGDFMTGFQAGPYTLGANGDLESLLNFYTQDGTLAVNSFNAPRYAAGNGWNPSDVFRSDLASPDCGGITPIQCGLDASLASVVIVSFTPSNATALLPDEFNANLQSIISTAISEGVIPILATLPDDGSVDAETLAFYNEIIVNLATNAQVPLWNAYNTLAPVGAGNVYTVGNGNPADLSDSGLTGGANRRNLGALRALQAVRSLLP